MIRDHLRDLALALLVLGEVAGYALARHHHRCADERLGQLRSHLSDSAIRQGWILARLDGMRR